MFDVKEIECQKTKGCQRDEKGRLTFGQKKSKEKKIPQRVYSW